MKEKSKLKIILKISEKILYIFFLFIYFLSVFINNRFGNISFEQLIFNIINTEGANYEIIFVGMYFIFIRLALIIIVFYALKWFYKWLKIKIFVNFKIGNITKKIQLFRPNLIKSVILLLFVISFCICNSIKLLKIDEFIESQKTSSSLFEDYYVDARDVELKFPNKKRNLIYIYLESMESTNFSIENGGFVQKTYIPNLEKLALENVNFSNTDKLGGAYQLSNSYWTIAGLIAQTSGVPLKLYVGDNDYKGFSNSLPGVHNLGDILTDNGYSNYFMIGSNVEFGGRKDYFTNHGNYTIYDYYSAIDEKLIDSDYFVWWGYEDKKLFEFAKEKLLDVASSDEPFNFTILTVDTHFTDGYMDDSCKEVFDSKYANALYCSDKKINSFIKWLKKQDFYDDTTIILAGDHLTMQSNFYDPNINSKRTVYNAFINSPIEPINEKNREFSTLDMFPTTLAALGVEIDGNKLGLGVNLFSDEKTLVEELGFEFLNSEIPKKSFFYDNVILGDTYYEMKELQESTN